MEILSDGKTHLLTGLMIEFQAWFHHEMK